jgi:ABC-type transporter MlaC component
MIAMQKLRSLMLAGASLVLGLALAEPGLARAADLVPQGKVFMTELIEVANHSKAGQGAVDVKSQAEVKELSKKVDFEALARKSLGAKWKTFPPAQRHEFLSTLQELLEVVAYPRASKIALNPDDLKYDTVKGKSNEVKATGRIQREKRGELVTQDMEFVMIFDPKSKKVVDAVFEDEKISSNLNRQFTAALKKKSFQQIIDQMKKRVAEAKSKDAKVADAKVSKTTK